MSTARDAVLDHIATRIAELSGEAITTVGVDGVDGAGKTRFADALADRLHGGDVVTIRVGLGGFCNPRAIRERQGADSPEGYYRDTYDLDALRTWLLFPARIGLPFRTEVFDAQRNRRVAVNPLLVPPPAVLVVDGPFLNRPELRDEWDLSIYLDVPSAVAYARLAARDGSNPDPEAPANRRTREAQRLYLGECRPQLGADIVIDYADLDAPRIVRG